MEVLANTNSTTPPGSTAATHALECYHCSSETIGSEQFCGRTFQKDSIPETLDKYNLSVVRSCTSTSEHLIPTCRKTVEEKNGNTITKRFCFYTNKSDSIFCNEPHDGSRVFCQDCFTDKCNSAPHLFAQQLGFIFIPLLVAKVTLI
ncbi:uncharacterized protein LOC129907566 [Episyrphus balteatus]|uniref:uncharacterized protein LOC129907566 n=1 Tax=Episyrphus balteatus TaxID=286459 RepID=UPI002484D857|nr:uncharacterized protein LOC129907566 [Episyrphus balteatus]